MQADRNTEQQEDFRLVKDVFRISVLSADLWLDG